MKKTLLSFCCSLLASAFMPAKAQFFQFDKGTLDASVTVGAANYYGDLAPDKSFFSTYPKLTRPTVGITVARELVPNLDLRAGFSWARIKGSDAINGSDKSQEDARRQRNLSFRNDIKELSVVGVYYLLNDVYTRQNYRNKYAFQPYVLAGLSVFHHNPKAYYNGNLLKEGWYSLQPLHTEGEANAYHRIQLALPFGGGIRYAINKDLAVSFELIWRKTFTDYLDDVSTNFVDKGQLNAESGKAAWVLSDRSIELSNNSATYQGNDGSAYPFTRGISSTGAVRGNSLNKDWFITSAFNLTYRLRFEKQLPKFR